VAKHRADRATKGRHRAPARNRVSTVGTVIRTMGVVAALGFSAPVVLDQGGYDDTVVSEYRGESGVESSGSWDVRDPGASDVDYSGGWDVDYPGTWEVEDPGTGDAAASTFGTRIG
jgi:hypothetical protein